MRCVVYFLWALTSILCKYIHYKAKHIWQPYEHDVEANTTTLASHERFAVPRNNNKKKKNNFVYFWWKWKPWMHLCYSINSKKFDLSISFSCSRLWCCRRNRADTWRWYDDFGRTLHFTYSYVYYDFQLFFFFFLFLSSFAISCFGVDDQHDARSRIENSQGEAFVQQQYTSCDDVNERIDMAFQSFLFFPTQKLRIHI